MCIYSHSLHYWKSRTPHFYLCQSLRRNGTKTFITNFKQSHHFLSSFFSILLDNDGRIVFHAGQCLVAHGSFSSTWISARNGIRNVRFQSFRNHHHLESILIVFSHRMQAVQNLGMAVVTMLAGRIVDGQGYLVLEVFFLGWLCCKFIFSLSLSNSHSSIYNFVLFF